MRVSGWPDSKAAITLRRIAKGVARDTTFHLGAVGARLSREEGVECCGPQTSSSSVGPKIQEGGDDCC
jgi:hypothetical protein